MMYCVAGPMVAVPSSGVKTCMQVFRCLKLGAAVYMLFDVNLTLITCCVLMCTCHMKMVLLMRRNFLHN